MSAPVRDEDFRVGRAISEQEWAHLRRESLIGLPSELDPSDPDIFMAYQRRLLETTAVNQVTVCPKSRRVGATWGVGADAVLTSAAARDARGMDTLYIGYNLDMAREFIDVCAMWAVAFSQAATAVGEFLFDDVNERDPADTKHIQAFRIRFASGFEITALSSRPRSLRGRQGYVIIDEAAFHDDLEGLLKAAFALLIWGGKVLVISSHNGEGNPFNRLVEDVRAGRRPYALVEVDFDQALQDGLYRRVCLRKGEEWSPEGEAAWRAEIIAIYGDGADEELFVIPSEGTGFWLLPAVIEACMRRDIPVHRWEMPAAFAYQPEEEREALARSWCETVIGPSLERLDPRYPSFFGQDFGRVSDLTDIWPIQILPGMIRETPFLVELRNIPFAQQFQILCWIIDRLPRFCGGAMDAGGNGAAQAEYAAQKYGPGRIAQIKFSIDWYRENMPKLKDALERRGMSLPADPDVSGDFKLVKIIDGIARVPRTRTVEKGEGASEGKTKRRHGDAAIAAALAYFASLMPVVEYAYRSAPRSQGDDERMQRRSSDYDDDRPDPLARRPLGARLRGSL
ncbi:hypothetical protein [Methylobacterium sp. Leaf85]|uniref:hypothetical protein n=1 Tax=Methylobacterium sp. Leaf85 TaxID=1736241 RepID=UPI0006F66EA4|nr:hypothetical protein [Methylobacterium sp. Leaf85]KQO53082.1 hypothetical protein ASF08_19345 [Methylobacterium sp. Leaf85]